MGGAGGERARPQKGHKSCGSSLLLARTRLQFSPIQPVTTQGSLGNKYTLH